MESPESLSKTVQAEVDRLSHKLIGNSLSRLVYRKRLGVVESPMRHTFPPDAEFPYKIGHLRAENVPKRILVGISGVPGSGKTTLASLIAASINDETGTASASCPTAVNLPMDGFHYSRSHLASMPNPEYATHRRGAAFTFDAEGFRQLVRRLAVTPATEDVYAPSFDHATKDPVQNAICVPSGVQIVLIEGNYCALDREPWRDAAGLMTELWYIDTPAKVTHKRLSARHLKSGIVKDEKEAWERATGTDEVNAKDIRENRLPCHEVIVMA